MLLSCRMLNNVADVNTWEYVNQAEFTAGDAPTIYIQLIDLSKQKAEQGFNPAGKRFMPAAGATLTVLVDTLDDAKKVTRAATQPFSNDPSIWALTFFPTDSIKGTATLRLTLIEPGPKTTKGSSAPGSVVIYSPTAQ
jgi:hypothetical protein